MHHHYADIRDRLGTPLWWDEYGVPRYCEFGPNEGANKVLQVSEGFTYELGANGPVPGSVELDGNPIADDDSQSYRIVTNNFLSDGGDNFPAFEDGTAKYFGGLDIDAFSDYLSANSPYTAGELDRIIDATP